MMGSSWLAPVVDVLATYRITRLVVKDTITRRPRCWLIGRAYAAADRAMPEPSAAGETCEELVGLDDDAPKVATLVTCPWCAGMWVALGVAAIRVAAGGPVPRPRLLGWLSYALALSGAAGLLAQADHG
jgi:hypothetical protein